MYNSELIKNRGYTIVYARDNKLNQKYWGVDTQRRNIFMINIGPNEYSQIERILLKADIQYRGMKDE